MSLGRASVPCRYSRSRAQTSLRLEGRPTACGEYCLIGPRRLDSGNGESSILHAVELNEIQLSLLRASPEARWTAACEIRSQNGLTNFRYAKDYDAIVSVGLDDGERCFALEYERSAKAKKEYFAIANLLDQEKQISDLLLPGAQPRRAELPHRDFYGHSGEAVVRDGARLAFAAAQHARCRRLLARATPAFRSAAITPF